MIRCQEKENSDARQASKSLSILRFDSISESFSAYIRSCRKGRDFQVHFIVQLKCDNMALSSQVLRKSSQIIGNKVAGVAAPAGNRSG